MALVASLLMALLAGCGGGGAGGADTASNAPALSKAEFVKQADAICEKAHEAVKSRFAAYQQELGLSEGQWTPKDEEAAMTKIIIPSLQEQAKAIDQLGVPKGDEPSVALLVKALEEVADEGVEDPLSILGEEAWSNAGSAAKRLQLKVCSRPF
ncbi:MAG TPA: hypothetical protein VHI77_00345 [Solirubrobacterales bacterium]|nr:hypothetical protein [Solirubrobacterales bacterium]